MYTQMLYLISWISIKNIWLHFQCTMNTLKFTLSVSPTVHAIYKDERFTIKGHKAVIEIMIPSVSPYSAQGRNVHKWQNRGKQKKTLLF